MDNQTVYEDPADVSAAAYELSRLLLPRPRGIKSEEMKHELGEIRLLDGASIIVGLSNFAGYIDDSKRFARSFAQESYSSVAHFDMKLRERLEARRYTFRNTIDPRPHSHYNTPDPGAFIHGQSLDVLKFLKERNVLPQLREIFRGNVSPLVIAGRLKEDFRNTAPTNANARIDAPFGFIPGRVIG